MTLTEDEQKAIFSAFVYERAHQPFEPLAEWLPACERSREKGWLVREVVRGDRARYRVGPENEAALAIGGAINEARPPN